MSESQLESLLVRMGQHIPGSVVTVPCGPHYCFFKLKQHQTCGLSLKYRYATNTISQSMYQQSTEGIVYKRQSDGIYFTNPKSREKRLRTALAFVAMENPADVIDISSQNSGQ
ncbi:hypothetical protein ACRRTK_017432 [Alexandromys fortis]